MKTEQRRDSWLRHMWSKLIIAVLLLVVAIACLIIFGPQLDAVIPGTAFGPTLPQSLLTGVYARAMVDSIHVTRTEDLTTVLPPLDKTVTNAATAQELYNAAFALPAYPSGTINCPLGADITYHLAFTRHGVSVLTITANGCERVSLGGLGDRLANGEFWQTLAGALGMSVDALWSYSSK